MVSIALVAAACSAAAFLLALPRGQIGTGRLIGYALGGVALLLIWLLLDAVPGRAGLTVITYLAGAFAIVAAFLMVTRRSPVASALWFAASVVSGAVLMFAAGAQFLGAATVIVYAGAVIVMFLFVIMLAQQEGWAPCDREAHEAPLAALTLLFLLVALLGAAARYRPAGPYVPKPQQQYVSSVAAIEQKPHTAGLGALLFSEHVVTIEVVGTLLLVAMVGAVVIAARRLIVPPPEDATNVG